MKLKYIIPSFIALVAMLVGCSDNYEAAYLDDLRVSSSYVIVPADGQSPAELTVRAAGNWEIQNIPNWLTVTPQTGNAGETKVTLSAPATTGALSTVLKIVSGSYVQEVNVVQGKVVAEMATCKQIIDGNDGKTFRVRAAITQIANTHYGNMYIDDGTGTVYIYGTNDKDGKAANDPIASWGLELGDIVTVEGPKTTYNGTVELVNVTVLKVEKSLVKVLEPETAPVIKKEGGELTVKLSFKGALVPTVPDAYDWIRYKTMSITKGTVTAVDPNPADTALVKFAIDENAAGARKGAVSFAATQGSQSSSVTFEFSQEGAITECPIADFLAAEVGTAQYRLTGIITNVAKADYGNVYIADYSGEVYVYGIGAKGDFGKLGLKEGDIVTLLGNRGEYKGTPQMTGGQYESSISVNEVTIDEFLTKADATDVYYKVTGTVDEIANATYGNLYLKSGDTRLYVYGCYPGWGATGDARKNCLANKDIAVGDELTVIGVKSTYKDTPQVNGGIYFSHKKAN